MINIIFDADEMMIILQMIIMMTMSMMTMSMIDSFYLISSYVVLRSKQLLLSSDRYCRDDQYLCLIAMMMLVMIMMITIKTLRLANYHLSSL